MKATFSFRRLAALFGVLAFTFCLALPPVARAQTSNLLNLNFGASNRVGTAVTWFYTNDAWNIIPPATNVSDTYGGTPIVTWGQYTNLLWAGSNASTVTVSITNLTYLGTIPNISDNMFRTYLATSVYLVNEYDPCTSITTIIYSNPKIAIQNMPSNVYDIVIYGLGAGTGDDSSYTITIGNGSPSSAKHTTYPSDPDPITTDWVEGFQYVKFTNIVVNAGERVLIEPNVNSYMNIVINGLQIGKAGGAMTNAVTPTISPASGSFTNPVTVSITNYNPECTYQYTINGGGWTDYTGPLTLVENTTVIAYARHTWLKNSGFTTNTYTFPDNDGDGLTDAREVQLGTDPWNPDTDYDGRLDGQEIADGTNPLATSSVLPTRLAYWKFSNTSWLAEGGQAPIVKTNIQNLTGWDGNVLQINTNVAPARLAYRDTETSLVPNITLGQGTVRFWFRPNWAGTNAGGTGPGHAARLIELGAYSGGATHGQWVIAATPEGTEIQFSMQAGGLSTNILAAGINFQSNVWHQIAITYTATNSAIYIDGYEVDSDGGVPYYPSAAVRAADGLNIGSDRDGDVLAMGQFDELETFNYPLSAEDIAQNWDNVAGRDSDGDGLSDIKEREGGTDPFTSDVPFWVLILSPRPSSILP